MPPLYWISTGQALVWAGSPEDLAKACARSGLLARYGFLLQDGRGRARPDSYIPVSWWMKALSVHIEADRITFVLPGPAGTHRVLTAFGVEFLGGAAEKLFPPSERLKRIKAVPAAITVAMELPAADPAAAGPLPSKLEKSKGGSNPLPIWSEIVAPHFDKETKQKGPFDSLGKARDAIKLELETRGKAVPDDRTIERWINRHRADWIKGGVRGA
jgi:hypothetical protein